MVKEVGSNDSEGGIEVESGSDYLSWNNNFLPTYVQGFVGDGLSHGHVILEFLEKEVDDVFLKKEEEVQEAYHFAKGWKNLPTCQDVIGKEINFLGLC